MIRVLRSESETFKKLESLNQYLIDNQIELYQTAYNGIIYKVGDRYYKYGMEGEYTETLPPPIEGRYIECDENGNTDYYN